MSLYFCSLSPFRTISGGCRLNRNVLFQPVRQSRVFTLNLLRRQKKETPQKTEIQKQDLQFYFKFFLRRPQLLLLASAGSEINIYIYLYIKNNHSQRFRDQNSSLLGDCLYQKHHTPQRPLTTVFCTQILAKKEEKNQMQVFQEFSSKYMLSLPFVLLCISPSQWFSNCGVQGPHWWGVDDRGGKTRRENKMIFHQKTQLI